MTSAGSDRQLVGTWVKLPTVEVIELLAVAGLDFVIVDLEHGAISIETASQMIGAARAAGLKAFVRVPEATAGYVQPMLDAGADGIVVPRVDNLAAAQEAVRAVRFPPRGNRGASPSGRAGHWGTRPLADYVRDGDGITLIAQIESMDAVAAIADIAAVPGIDVVFIGEVDLATSSGLSIHDASLRDRVDAAEEVCRSGGVALGGVAKDGADAQRKFERGYRLLTISTDLGFLRGGAADAVEAARGGSSRIAPGPDSRQITPALQQELLQLVTTVWYDIDQTDGTGVSSHFARDATLTISRATVHGTAEIDALYATRHARGPRVSRHCVVNLHVLEADATSAAAISTLLLYAEDGEAPRHLMSPVLIADVEDTFVRDGGRWLIQTRHIKTRFQPEDGGGLAVPTD